MSRVPLRQRRKADFESLWLVTFADLMVQLMAFFAVIYSYSQLDQSNLKELLGQFQKAVGLKVQAIGPGSSLIGV
ncbi:MAG TPA: flagellar motor protein MotB, partial [Holophaga sp.]|nr:flagellar motor protein MotB [Holophaga sp.]